MSSHTEAPASVTYNIVSPDGFDVLFTVRGDSDIELMDIMTNVEKGLIEKGYKAKGGYSGGAKSSGSRYGGSTSSSGSRSSGGGGDRPASAKQREILQDRGLWRDGMTVSEASAELEKILGK